MFKKISFVSAVLLAIVSVSGVALAVDKVNLERDVKTVKTSGLENASTTKTVKISAQEQNRIKKAVINADKEISRRIDSLNKLAERITAMKKVFDSDKTVILANVTTEIGKLNALKAKIDADTDLATLKTDIKSITDSYRIYALVIPQGQIMASVDSINTVADSLSVIATKLQTRITEADGAGKDTTKLKASLVDLNAKIVEAKTLASDARNLIAPLVPDNGDKTVQDANKTALDGARKKIKAAEFSLKTARKDADSILKGLKTMGLNKSASASSTAPSLVQ